MLPFAVCASKRFDEQNQRGFVGKVSFDSFASPVDNNLLDFSAGESLSWALSLALSFSLSFWLSLALSGSLWLSLPPLSTCVCVAAGGALAVRPLQGERTLLINGPVMQSGRHFCEFTLVRTKKGDHIVGVARPSFKSSGTGGAASASASVKKVLPLRPCLSLSVPVCLCLSLSASLSLPFPPPLSQCGICVRAQGKSVGWGIRTHSGSLAHGGRSYSWEGQTKMPQVSLSLPLTLSVSLCLCFASDSDSDSLTLPVCVCARARARVLCWRFSDPDTLTLFLPLSLFDSPKGSRVGLLLDLGEGSLTCYLNGQKLGSVIPEGAQVPPALLNMSL